MQISAPKPFETSWLWLAKILSGVLVFALILVHVVVNHLVASGGLLSYADVVRYLSNPWIGVMESTFLVVVVCHALLGTRSILLDLNPGPRILRAIDFAFTGLGIGAIVYGIWLIRLIATRGA